MVYHCYLPVKIEKTDLIIHRCVGEKFYNKNCAKCNHCSKKESVNGRYDVECRLDKSKVGDIDERVSLYDCGVKKPATSSVS